MAAVTAPAVVRRLSTPAALALADLAATFEDLQTVLECCERLVVELEGARDPLALEAFWTTAVISYARCFSLSPRGTGLTDEDVTGLGLAGDVIGWHRALLQMRKRYGDPRGEFSVGVVEDAAGHPDGVALTSPVEALVDDVSVRQTGAIAYALSARVDERIGGQQKVVFDMVKAMSQEQLHKLPVLDVVEPTG